MKTWEHAIGYIRDVIDSPDTCCENHRNRIYSLLDAYGINYYTSESDLDADALGAFLQALSELVDRS